ncbi:PP2C family serine/threonine-protein phosphatase [Bosea sp. BIWAKO-01]|uniref:PP2C family serine/threonine-protein phosphatase n=1 Tax=Bosea sp. BIWAKO-01 TaxID=506668 RepID=UPI000942ECA8
MRGSRSWGWVGACSIGTSHLRTGAGCDDAAACLEIEVGDADPALIAVVSDGAGSAKLSRLGSHIVTTAFCRSAKAFLLNGGQAALIDDDVAAEWLDDIRDRVDQRAHLLQESPKAFAATLVGVVVQRHTASIIHVGDGACALRLRGDTQWQVPSWPAQGEYASTTYFVTDDPYPRVAVSTVPGAVEEIALFTDGLERLALDFTMGGAFPRFFETMFPALRRAESFGRQRVLSRELRSFLDGSLVTERTDDDKTLIMARLRSAEARLSPMISPQSLAS